MTGDSSVNKKTDGSVWVGVIVEICFRMFVRNGYFGIGILFNQWPTCL